MRAAVFVVGLLALAGCTAAPTPTDTIPATPRVTAPVATIPIGPAKLAVPTTVPKGWPLRPDPVLTPGATLPVALTTLCTSGYTKTVRNVPASEAKAVFAAYSTPYADKGRGELDHLISLELGGSNDPTNLWPEFGKRPNAKDAEENRLHAAVCAGTMGLVAAQRAIVDWPNAHPGG